MKTHLPVALRKALIAAIFAVSAFAYNKAEAAVSVTPQNNVSVTETQDVEITAVESGREVTSFSVETDGKITVEESQGTLLNSSLKAGGDITIGDTERAANVLTMCGTGSTTVETKGSITVNQSIDIHVGTENNEGGAISITASEMEFNGAETKIQGSNETCTVTAMAGGITFNSTIGVTVSKNAIVKTTGGQDAHVIIESLPGDTGVAVNDISGSIESTGKVSVTGSVNQVIGQEINRASIEAKHGIDIIGKGGVYESSDQELVFGNFIGLSDLYAEKSDISIKDVYSNTVSESTVKAASGNISVTGGEYAYINASKIEAEKGGVEIQSTTVNLYKYFASPGSTSITAKENITIKGTGTDGDAVEITHDTSLVSQQGKIDILATNGSVSMKGGNVTAKNGSATISGASATNIAGVDVDGASITVGSETGATTITNTDDKPTTLDATGKIAVTGTTVSLTDISVDSTGTDADGVSVAITGSDVEVSGENVTGTGSVTIAGTTSTEVNGVDVDGASISVGSETGTTTITNTDDKDTTLDATGKIAVTGTTVSLTDISVDSTGTDADGVSVAITGSDVEVSGENVTGTGSVTIAGTTGTKVNGVDVDGASISVGSETGTTTITNTDDKDTTLDATGKIAVTGTTVSLTDISVDSTGTDADGVSVAITGSDVEVSGENVTGTGAVNIVGTNSSTLENVVVSGQAASITGGEVRVTGESVKGTDSVTIAGTTSTTIENVDMKESSTATIGSDTATGQTSLSNSSVVVEGEVAIAGGSVNITGNEGISSETGSVKISATAGAASIGGGAVTAEAGAVEVSGASQTTLENVVVDGKTASITGDEVSVTGESVTGTDSVTIAGTTSTTIKNVDVKGSATATIGSDTATGQTSLSNSSVVVEGEVAIAGGSVNITGNEGISSETGSVKITATAGAASIAGGAVTAKSGAVAVSGTTQTTLDNVAVDGNTVSLGNVDSATTITGGTVDGDGDVSVYGTELTVKDGVSIDSQDGKVTVSGATTEITGGNVTSKTGDVDIIGSTTNTLSGLSVGGKDVSVTGGAVFVTGGTVAGSAAVAIAGTTSTKVNGVDVDGKTVAVGDADSATTITGGTIDGKGDVSVYGTELTVKDAASIDSQDGKVTVSGATTEITGGNVTSKTGDVEIIGSTMNTLSGVSVGGKEVSVIGGDVSVTDGTVAGSEAVTIAGTTNTEVNGVDVDGKTIDVGAANSGTTISGGTIDGAAGVKVNGATVFVNNNAAIKAKDEDVSLNAGTVNYVDSGTSITAESGGVTIALAPATGAVNIVTGAIVENDIVVSTAPVSITAGGGALVIDGGVSGDNLIDYATMTAAGTAGSISIKGKTNAIGAAVTLQAATGITVSSLGTDALSGNKVDASTLVSAEGDIALDANYANHVSNGTVINAESGGVKIALTSDSGFANIVSGATDTAPNPVSITAGDGALMIDGGDSGENLVEYATLTAAGTDGRITIQGKANGVGAGATLLADKGVNIKSTGTDTDASDSSFDGNLVHASSITAKEGNVAVDAKSINRVIDADLVASAGAVDVSGHTNLVQAESTIQASADISVTSTGEAAGSGNYLEHSSLKTSAGSVEISAEQSNVVSNGSTVHANQDIDIISFGTGDNRGNVIKSSTLESDAGDVKLTAANINQVEASKITASGGAVELNGDSNLIYNGVTVQAAAGVSMTSSGIDAKDGNQISNSTVKTSDGDVVMTSNQFNAVINADISTGYMEGKGDIIIGDEGGSTETVTNGIVATEGHKTSIFAGQNVRVAGNNVIMGSNFGAVTIAAAQGDITLRDDNDITCAVIDAAGTDGDVAITTGTGDKGTTITNSGLYGQTVTIAGDTTGRSDDNLAVVTGENTRIASRADAGVGLTLNNVFVRDTEKGNANIFVKTQSDIAILNRVDLQNGTLTIKQGAASDGRIVVDTGNVLNARAESSLEGRLTGAGDINKSGGDSLLLNYDHSEFSGSIYANGAVGGAAGSVVDEPAANAGSWIEISGAGVGAEASIVLKNTDLVISTDKTRIGTLDTTQDSDVNEKGTGDTLLTDGSYTADGNERADFTTVGSVLEVNKGKAGDVVQASDMKLSDATLIKLDAEVNGAEVKADTINASGTINAAAVTGLNSTSTAAAPSTARVYIRHADLSAASNAAEGARTTIMTGTMAADINEDVLYDVALSDNGTYQRTLQDRNVHLENKGDHVDLVYSKNYRSAAKDAHLNQVADALKELSDSFHHTEGTLASSSDTMKRLVDAFDYTRSEEAALRGLRSVAGTGNVLPRLMQFDSSRRHLSALRQQMEMPVCKYAWKGALNRTNNVWMSYTGAYDNLSGDSNMGDYSRNAHGAIVGVDRSLSCKLRVGLSLGYETSTGKADDSKVDADTFFVDAYATGVTGQFKHRASVGLAASSFEYDRNVLVEAGYHTFNGLVKGETDGITLNFGYELSSDYHFTERSRMTRYLAVNLAWHQLDFVKENGMGNVGLTTEFEDEWQADLAVGVNYIREFAALRNQKLASFYANAAVHLELLNDRVTATNRLGDTGAGWQTSSMERSPLYFELGAGVVVPLSPTWTGTAGATFEIGPDRYGFSGGVGVRYSF